jgi:hypothetical protein
MASAGARAYMGVWGPCPQRGPGAEPLVRGSGGFAPLKLKAFCVYESKFCLEICSFLLSFKKLYRTPKNNVRVKFIEKCSLYIIPNII